MDPSYTTYQLRYRSRNGIIFSSEIESKLPLGELLQKIGEYFEVHLAQRHPSDKIAALTIEVQG